MDGNRRGAVIIVAVTAMLIALSFIIPRTAFLKFTGHPAKVREVPAEPSRSNEVRAKATVPVPRRYIDAARSEVAGLMADPAWRSLDQDSRETKLLEVLVLHAADAEYWSMPEARQRRVSRAFVEAFLDGGGRGPVDK